MKIQIVEDERYPDFIILETAEQFKSYFGPIREVDARKVKRWQKAIEEYEKVQEEIEALVKS